MDNERLGTSGIEIAEPVSPTRTRHAVLDLDGTISTLRDGWQDAMVPLLVEELAACPRGPEGGEPQTAAELEALVIDFVDHLTGKQTIYQMLRLAEEIAKRGGEPKDPLEYKRLYNERLQTRLDERHAALRAGADPSPWLLAGARDFLEALRARDITCYLASGTDVEFVKLEMELLGVAEFFDGGIFGALADYESFSKEKVIQDIVKRFSLSGPELLVVGDGYVEIQNARAVGAIAFGVHSEENNRYHMNADKRGRLIHAGAQFLAPDLREGAVLLAWLAGE